MLFRVEHFHVIIIDRHSGSALLEDIADVISTGDSTSAGRTAVDSCRGLDRQRQSTVAAAESVPAGLDVSVEAWQCAVAV
jgi:hypothetical protein